jgi:hypothetical protein
MPLGFDHEVTVPQHNYKLELHNQYRHAGESDWRHYRNSVLRSLPHKWASKEDTKMYTSHFSKTSKRDVNQESQQADAAHAREVGFFSSSDPVKGAASSGASAKKSRISKRRKSKSAKIDAIKARRGGSADAAARALERQKHANVLVVHRREGVEVLHLHTGRPLLELPLPTNMVHADLNMDGSVDRVEAVVSDHSVVRPEGHRMSDAEEANRCYAWVTTGTPPTHALFNESICQASSPMAVMMQMMVRGMRRGGEGEGNVKLLATPPVVVTRKKDRELIGAIANDSFAALYVSHKSSACAHVCACAPGANLASLHTCTTHTHTHTRIHTHTHTHTHTRTHILTYANVHGTHTVMLTQPRVILHTRTHADAYMLALGALCEGRPQHQHARCSVYDE